MGYFDILFEAAYHGSISVLIWLKVNCPSLLTPDFLNVAACYADRNRQIEAIEWLVENGANINDRDCEFPMHEAANNLNTASDLSVESSNSAVDTFKWLLERGTPIDISSMNDAGPLLQPLDAAFSNLTDGTRGQDEPFLSYDSVFWLVLYGASSEDCSASAYWFRLLYASKPLLLALLLGENEKAKTELEKFKGRDHELQAAILLMIALQREEILDAALQSHGSSVEDIWEDLFEVAACTRNLELLKKIYSFVYGQLKAGKEGAEGFRRALEVGLRWSVISRAEPLFYFLLERAIAYGHAPNIRLSAVGSMVTGIVRYHDRLARENRGELLQSHEYAMFRRMRDCLRRATYLQLSAGVHHTRSGFNDANIRLTNLIRNVVHAVPSEHEEPQEIAVREIPREVAELIINFILGPSNAPPQTVAETRDLRSHFFNMGIASLERVRDSIANLITSHPRITLVAMMLMMYAMNSWTSSSNM